MVETDVVRWPMVFSGFGMLDMSALVLSGPYTFTNPVFDLFQR
jgi:hypothetical protein